MKSITGPDSAILTGLASIHLVNLSTMTSKYFFLVGSAFKGSNHVKPPDRERTSDGDSLEGSGWHMALVCKKLATYASLDQVLSVCSGRRPIKACTESLAYKGPSCSVVATESGVNFSQQVPPFLSGDAPLKDSGSAFLIKLSLVDFIGFRSPYYAACLVLVLWEFLPSKVG